MAIEYRPTVGTAVDAKGNWDIFTFRMSDRLQALHLFVRVAHTASFSRASREFGMSQPSASRIIADLERRIGVALFTRTTRAVKLTEAGSDYLSRIEPLLVSLEAADHAVRGTGELRGLLRVALSSSLSVREIIPRLPVFVLRHPNLRIELLVNDAHQELVTEGVDVALRLGKLPDSSATARRLGAMPRLLVASPEYLQENGEPKSPGDLLRHSLILGPAGNRSSSWVFHRKGRRTAVRIEPRLTTSSNESAIAAAIACLGIAATATWGCRAELERGSLVSVLNGWKMGAMDLNALFPAGRAAKPAARAFVEYLATALHE